MGVITSPPYRVRSSTNWSLTRSDSIDIEVVRYNQVDGWGDVVP